MTTIKIMTCDQVLSFIETPTIACGDVKTIKLEVTTCSEWDGYALSAVFYTNLDPTAYEVLLTDNACIVPYEVLRKCTTLHIGIRGVQDDAVKTSAILDYKIVEGAPSGQGTTTDPTPTVYQQIISTLDTTKKTADNAATLAEQNAETLANLETDVNNFKSADESIQEVIDARTGSKVANTFATLAARLAADFNLCINQSTLETALSSVTTAYTTADRAQNALLLTAMGLTKGSKNLLKNTASSITKNGIEFTVNDDGSVTANGTATADAELVVRNMTVLANTKYILSGCPANTADAWQYRIYAINTSTWAIAGADYGYGNGYTLSTGNYTKWSFRIQIKSGCTADNLVFYPMLRYATIPDDTFEPYTPSLQEQINDLTAAVTALGGTIAVTAE